MGTFCRLLLVIGAVFEVLTLTVSGHADPQGDIHPIVRVENGCFAVYFCSSTSEIEADETLKEKSLAFRMVFSTTGRLLAPRHRVTGDEYRGVGKNGFKKGSVTGLLTPGFEIVGEKGTSASYSLPLMDGFGTLQPWSTVSTAEGIGVTAVALDSPDKLRADAEEYLFFWYPFALDESPTRVEIGLPIYIYTFPRASNAVFAGGRFWIAFMSQGAKLLMWSWKPGEEKPRTKILEDSPYHWNCHLSLAAIGNRLCLAYHCATAHGAYGRKARIFTVFEKVE